MRVTQVNIKFKDSIPDDEYWVDRAEYRASIAEDNFCRFELIEEIESDKLALDNLVEHGLIKAPQSAQTLKAETLKLIFETLGKEYFLTLAKIHPKQLFRISWVDQRCDGVLFRS